VSHLSASAVVIHCKEALYQVYVPYLLHLYQRQSCNCQCWCVVIESDVTDSSVSCTVAASIERTGVNFFPTVIVNDSKVLKCVTLGIPRPVIKWYKDSRPLAADPVNDIRIRENGGKLKIRSATLNDDGLYECRAENDAGQDRVHYQLTVLGQYCSSSSCSSSSCCCLLFCFVLCFVFVLFCVFCFFLLFCLCFYLFCCVLCFVVVVVVVVVQDTTSSSLSCPAVTSSSDAMYVHPTSPSSCSCHVTNFC